MFKQRLLTTLVLVPLILLAIYYANTLALALVVWGLAFACAFEWLQLIPLKAPSSKGLMLLALLACLYLSPFAFFYWLPLGLVVWAIIAFMIQQFPRSQALWGYRLPVSFFCLMLLPLFAQSLMMIFVLPAGKDLIVYLLFLVWAADIGAYLAGKTCGRHKLIPAVSPGKTIEGVLGGFVLAMLVAFVGFCLFKAQNCLSWMLLATAVVVISLVGDLFISMLKRRSQIKDTGQLLPGHGGVLDRLDSLIAAAPLFYYGLQYAAPEFAL